MHKCPSRQDYFVSRGKMIARGEFCSHLFFCVCVGGFFSVSINKCISCSQGLSKFIKAAGSAPRETHNPSLHLTDSQGEPKSNHRLLPTLSPNLISSLSNSFVLTLTVLSGNIFFSPSTLSPLPFFFPNHLFSSSSSSKNHFITLPHSLLTSPSSYHLFHLCLFLYFLHLPFQCDVACKLNLTSL